jgi:hypothetical protein
VSFQGGALTIVAENSTLGDILRSVQSQTKAQVDVPANATERVVGQFGPGPACDVLASLLKGSHFNYVLLASDSNPSNLGRVILTSKTGSDAVAGNGAPAQAGMRPVQPNYPAPGGAQAQAQEQDETPDGGDEVVDDSAAEQEEPEQPDDSAQQEDQQAQQQQQNGTTPPGVKTPEQLLQELQQRQQQMGQPGQPVNQGFPPATAPNTPPQPPQQ